MHYRKAASILIEKRGLVGAELQDRAGEAKTLQSFPIWIALTARFNLGGSGCCGATICPSTHKPSSTARYRKASRLLERNRDAGID